MQATLIMQGCQMALPLGKADRFDLTIYHNLICKLLHFMYAYVCIEIIIFLKSQKNSITNLGQFKYCWFVMTNSSVSRGLRPKVRHFCCVYGQNGKYVLIKELSTPNPFSRLVGCLGVVQLGGLERGCFV